MANSSFALASASGYTEDYLDIDDILASHERIPCKFNMPVSGLGYLDPSSDQNDLAEGTKLELPYWLARALCSRKRRIVSIDLPKPYREGYRDILQADANVVDLHKLGPYYFIFGTHLLNFETADATDIAKSMVQAFQDRFRRIMDYSQNAYYEDMNNLISKLDNMERNLFAAGQQGLSDFQRWETRETDKISISDMVDRHRKRKRVVMETT